MTEERDYHRQRAARELHLGLACQIPAASRAHLKLSTLHFERLRTLEGGHAASKIPSFVL